MIFVLILILDSIGVSFCSFLTGMAELKLFLSLQMLLYFDLTTCSNYTNTELIHFNVLFFSYQLPSLFIQVIWEWEWYNDCLQHFLQYITIDVYIQMHPYGSFRLKLCYLCNTHFCLFSNKTPFLKKLRGVFHLQAIVYKHFNNTNI